MALKKYSEFTKVNKNKLTKTDREDKHYNFGSHVSASDNTADKINHNTLKRKRDKTKSEKPRKYKTTKTERTIKDKSIYPPETKDKGINNMSENVEFYGKLAKFPEGVEAGKAFNWMNNLKDPKLAKKDIWYLMVEKQSDELQMIRYQQKEGVNLGKFVVDLKNFYIDKYSDNERMVENIKKIKLGGDKKGYVSSIKNIPNIKTENNIPLVTKITEDLVKLLS